MMRKIFKNIAMICLAVCVAIGSFFVPLKSKSQNNFASANTSYTTYSFEGSNVYMPIRRYKHDNTDDFIQSGLLDFLLLRINFSYDRTVNNFTIDFSNSLVFAIVNQFEYNNTEFNYKNVVDFGLMPGFNDGGVGAESVIIFDLDYYPSNFVEQPYTFTYRPQNSSTYRNATCVVSFHSDVGEIIGCEFGNEYYSVDDDVNDWSSFFGPYNYISYFDADGKFVKIKFKALDESFEYRVYYFSDNVDFTDNQIYNQGYQQGLEDNQSNIYNNGYDDGYDVGFDRGRINGVAESNNYSFLGLIGAVVDAPVSILSSLFNFTFLGINLWSFITSLLTIALILFVVKIFMRR